MSTPREDYLAVALTRTHEALNDLLGFVEASRRHGSANESIREYLIFPQCMRALYLNRRQSLVPGLPLSGNLVADENALIESLSVLASQQVSPEMPGGVTL